MKILYAIQGTGNGHLSRARDIIPLLQQKATVHVLVSGSHCEVKLPYPITYPLKGLGFVFGKNGGIDLLETYRKANLKQFFEEIKQVPVEEYDIVISDFEPVSSWACKLKHLPCIGLSHQAAVIHKKSPKPKKKDWLGKAILENYAPVTASYGFHFLPYAKNIFTPVIRQQVREGIATKEGHYTVYLPAYSDEKIIKVLSGLPQVKWEVFSKHSNTGREEGNVLIRPIENEAFLKSLLSCTGVLCGAGFETPAEALYLDKKLLAIPMKGQYEQQCNAAALEQLGVPIIKSLKKKHHALLQTWIELDQEIKVHYADETEMILDKIIAPFEQQFAGIAARLEPQSGGLKKMNYKKLRKLLTELPG